MARTSHPGQRGQSGSRKRLKRKATQSPAVTLQSSMAVILPMRGTPTAPLAQPANQEQNEARVAEIVRRRNMVAAQNTIHSLPPGEAPRENLKRTTTTTTVAQEGTTLRIPKKSRALRLKVHRRRAMMMKRTKKTTPALTVAFSRMSQVVTAVDSRACAAA